MDSSLVKEFELFRFVFQCQILIFVFIYQSEGILSKKKTKKINKTHKTEKKN